MTEPHNVQLIHVIVKSTETQDDYGYFMLDVIVRLTQSSDNLYIISTITMWKGEVRKKQFQHV